MAYHQQIYSFSQWHAIHEDMNFLKSDVQLVEDELLLETSGRRCFRFLKGSERKSPRLRAREGYCVILQYLGGRRYLARTVGSKTTPSPTNRNNDRDNTRFINCNRKDQQSRDHFKFLVLDDSLTCPENTEVIFEWSLADNCQRVRGVSPPIEAGSSYSEMGRGVVSIRQDDRTSEVVWSSHPIGHFESYVSCRKRFVMVVGPPCLNYTQKQKEEEGEGKAEEKTWKEGNEEGDCCQPSSCIFDAEDLSMKVFRLGHSLGSADDRMNQWPANIAFDLRPSREHVAAVVACADMFDYLPRSGQTGSLLIVDVLRQRVLHARTERRYLSTDLQYTCTGEQLLTSFSHDDVVTSQSLTSSSSEAISSERRPSHFALLSSDDLSLLRLLSLSPTSTIRTPVLSSVLSQDFRNFAMFLYSSKNAVDTSQSSSVNASRPNYLPIDVVNFCFPAEVGSLFHLCLDVVRKLIPRKEMVDSLPIPKTVSSRLKEL